MSFYKGMSREREAKLSEVNLERMKTMFEKRLAETKEKFSKLNSVYVSERSSTFHLPEANYLNIVQERGPLVVDVMEQRLRALEKRNSDLEKRLMINETINDHFDQAICIYEAEISSIMSDALQAEVDRVAFIKHIQHENTEIDKAFKSSQRQVVQLTEENENQMNELSVLQEQYDELRRSFKAQTDALNQMNSKQKDLEHTMESARKQMEQDGIAFHHLQESCNDLKDQVGFLEDEIRSKNECIEIEKRKVNAVKEEFEHRWAREKELLTIKLLKDHDEELVAQKAKNNRLFNQMKSQFEVKLKEAAAYVDENNEILEKTQRQYAELKTSFDQKLHIAITEFKHKLEKKYREFASVQVEVPKVLSSAELPSERENVPRRILQEWQNSTVSSSSTGNLQRRPSTSRNRPLNPSSSTNQKLQ